MATEELVPYIMDVDMRKVESLFAEKGDLIDLSASDLDYQDSEGAERHLDRPLLLVAIETGSVELVRFLLEKGAEVNKYTQHVDPPGPLFFATECLHPRPSEEMALLLLQHADTSLQNTRGQTILFEAQLRSAQHAKDILTKFGINIAARPGLSIAARDYQGHSVVDEVLFHDMYQLMPMYQEYVFSLIKNNDVDTLRHLVFDGFDYLMKGGGVSAYDIAVESGAQEVAEFIQQVPTIMETIPLIHLSIGANNLDAIKDVLNRDYAVAMDTGGRCSLHLAIMCDQVETVQYLLAEYPETLKVKDNVGRTPLHYAAASSNEKMYDMLVAAGADSTVVECRNLTAQNYREELVSPGISGQEGLDIEGMLERERTTKYGIKIFLKLQYQQFKAALDRKDEEAARAVIDELPFGVDSFHEEGIIARSLLFSCVEAGAEETALYLIRKGADIKKCVVRDAYGGKVALQDAAFRAQLGGLYNHLANALGFKARRLSAFSESSSMVTEKVAPPPEFEVTPQSVPKTLHDADFDSQYLGKVLGEALTKGLSEVTQKRPWDPIEFLAQWLYKDHDNTRQERQAAWEKHQALLDKAEAEREAIRRRRHNKEVRHLAVQQQRRQAQLEAEHRAQEEAQRKAREQEELRKKQKEADQLAQAPDLDTVTEEHEPTSGALTATVTTTNSTAEEERSPTPEEWREEEGKEAEEGQKEEEQVEGRIDDEGEE